MKPTIALWIVAGVAVISRPAWGQTALASHEPACAFPAPQALPAEISCSQLWGHHVREPLPHADVWASYHRDTVCHGCQPADDCCDAGYPACYSLLDRFCTFLKAPIEGCRSKGCSGSHNGGDGQQCPLCAGMPAPTAVTVPANAPQPLIATPIEEAPVVPVVPDLERKFSPPIPPGPSPIVELAPEPALPDHSPAAPRNRVPEQRKTLPLNRVPR